MCSYIQSSELGIYTKQGYMHEINELRYEPKDYVVICLSTLYFRITIWFLW